MDWHLSHHFMVHTKSFIFVSNVVTLCVHWLISTSKVIRFRIWLPQIEFMPTYFYSQLFHLCMWIHLIFAIYMSCGAVIGPTHGSQVGKFFSTTSLWILGWYNLYFSHLNCSVGMGEVDQIAHLHRKIHPILFHHRHCTEHDISMECLHHQWHKNHLLI